MNHVVRLCFRSVDWMKDCFLRLKAVVIYRSLFRKFGKHSILRKPLLIAHPEHIEIGERVYIREGIRLEIVKDGVNADPLLSIGSDTNIEQNVHLVCHCSVRIGRRVCITANCTVVDTSHPYAQGSEKMISRRISTDRSFVEIGDDCFIGVGAVILPNVRIGDNCVIGANAVVTKDVPPNSIVAGVPAKILLTQPFTNR